MRTTWVWTIGPLLGLVSLILILLTVWPGDRDSDSYLLVEQGTAALSIVVLVTAGRKAGLAGWAVPSSRAWLWLAGPLWLSILGPLGLAFESISTTPSSAPLWILTALAVGLSEETVFRGFLLNGLRSRFRVVPAALISSLAFAVYHGLNALWNAHPHLLAAQAFYALGSGLVLAVLTLRTGSVWPAIGLHAAIDAVGLSALGGYSAALQDASATTGMFVAGALAVCWGAFWLLKSKRALDAGSSSPGTPTSESPTLEAAG